MRRRTFLWALAGCVLGLAGVARHWWRRDDDGDEVVLVDGWIVRRSQLRDRRQPRA